MRTPVRLLSLLLLCNLYQAARAGVSPSPGVNLNLSFTGESYAELHGGQKRGHTGIGNLYGSLHLDGGRLLGTPGLSAFVQGLLVRGGQPSALSGDAQGASNIEATPAAHIYEAWLQYNTPHSGGSVLLGLYDLNSEFDRLQTASTFINSSFGIGPTFSGSGVDGPSIFPRTSSGLRIAVKPSTGTVWRMAALDAAPAVRAQAPNGPFTQSEGLLLVSEFAYLGRSQPGTSQPTRSPMRVGRLSALPPYDHKLALGVWRYTRAQARVDGGGRAPSHGVYLLADSRLYVSPRHPGRVLSAFLQWGNSTARSNRFAHYAGAGWTLSAPFASRPMDAIGMAVGVARNGAAYQHWQAHLRPHAAHAETVYELTYQYSVLSGLSLQPDLQYITHPDTRRDIPAALVGQLLLQWQW